MMEARNSASDSRKSGAVILRAEAIWLASKRLSSEIKCPEGTLGNISAAECVNASVGRHDVRAEDRSNCPTFIHSTLSYAIDTLRSSYLQMPTPTDLTSVRCNLKAKCSGTVDANLYERMLALSTTGGVTVSSDIQLNSI